MEICTVEECGVKSHSKGFCSKHYSRFVRHGDVTIVINPWEGHAKISKSYTRSNVRHEKKERIYSNPRCLVTECENKKSRKGYCAKHFARFDRLKTPYIQPSLFKYDRHGPERTAWMHIKTRCYKVDDKDYSDYGGRGIKMYEGWINNFNAFYEYVGSRPSKEHSLDRINNELGYIPGNLRWATWHEQQSNKRNSNKFVGVSHLTYVSNGGVYKYWSAYLMINKKNVFNKLYKTKEEAIQARLDAEIKYLGKHLTRVR